MSHDTRAPIERMIDQACGYDPEKDFIRRNLVPLRCPRCKRARTILREKSDPSATATVLATCPTCIERGATAEVTFLDKDGNQIAEP